MIVRKSYTTQDIHDFFERLTENFYIEHRGKLRPAAVIPP